MHPRLWMLLLAQLATGQRVLLAVDDTPTKRHGPQVQGAGIHHNPTPGPADQKFLYGHIWVTISLVLRHSLWGTIGLPLLGLLDVRAKDIAKIPKKHGWEQVECCVDGRLVAKAIKTFLATYRPAGGLIRVVIVKEDHGCEFFFCTEPHATPREIIEAFGDRAAIEQDFHDVKEVWGAGLQQVRNIWTNVAVFHLNLWVHTLVEGWAWNKPAEELCDRSDSPWDDAARRPSHANRRRALRRQILQQELSNITTAWSLPDKMIQLATSLMALAT